MRKRSASSWKRSRRHRDQLSTARTDAPRTRGASFDDNSAASKASIDQQRASRPATAHAVHGAAGMRRGARDIETPAAGCDSGERGRGAEDQLLVDLVGAAGEVAADEARVLLFGLRRRAWSSGAGRHRRSRGRSARAAPRYVRRPRRRRARSAKGRARRRTGSAGPRERAWGRAATVDRRRAPDGRGPRRVRRPVPLSVSSSSSPATCTTAALRGSTAVHGTGRSRARSRA